MAPRHILAEFEAIHEKDWSSNPAEPFPASSSGQFTDLGILPRRV
jgi:hypothetical protein